MAKRGAFILFEGIDRCGKSTQSQRLVEHLNSIGHTAELLRFPDRTTPIGMMLDSYLRQSTELDDHTTHLLFSANRWEKRDVLLKKLQSGCTLVVDRYAFSGVAFTSAKGLDLEWCKAPDRGLPAPDVVLYMKLPVEVAMSRGGAGEERYEKVDFQKKVKTIFEEKLADSAWKSIDGTLGMDVIQDTLRDISQKIIVEVEEKPIGVLWEK